MGGLRPPAVRDAVAAAARRRGDRVRRTGRHLRPALGRRVAGRAGRSGGPKAGAQRLQGPRGLSARPGPPADRRLWLSRAERTPDRTGRGGGGRRGRHGVRGAARPPRRAVHVCGSAVALRGAGARQVRGPRAGVRFRHRAAVRVRRSGQHDRPRPVAEPGVLPSAGARHGRADHGQARRYLRRRHAAAPLRRIGSAGLQPGDLRRLLRRRRGGALLRAPGAGPAARGGRRRGARRPRRTAARQHSLHARIARHGVACRPADAAGARKMPGRRGQRQVQPRRAGRRRVHGADPAGRARLRQPGAAHRQRARGARRVAPAGSDRSRGRAGAGRLLRLPAAADQRAPHAARIGARSAPARHRQRRIRASGAAHRLRRPRRVGRGGAAPHRLRGAHRCGPVVRRPPLRRRVGAVGRGPGRTRRSGAGRRGGPSARRRGASVPAPGRLPGSRAGHAQRRRHRVAVGDGRAAPRPGAPDGSGVRRPAARRGPGHGAQQLGAVRGGAVRPARALGAHVGTAGAAGAAAVDVRHQPIPGRHAGPASAVPGLDRRRAPAARAAVDRRHAGRPAGAVGAGAGPPALAAIDPAVPPPRAAPHSRPRLLPRRADRGDDRGAGDRRGRRDDRRAGADRGRSVRGAAGARRGGPGVRQTGRA